MALTLGVLAGICLYGALHHLQIALHLRNRIPHLLLAASAVAFGFICLLSQFYYRPTTVAEFELQSRLLGAFGLVGVGTLYWFAGLRIGASRRLLLLSTAGLAIALVLNVTLPAGLLRGHITGYLETRLTTGEIFRRPIATGTPLKSWVLLPAGFLPVLVLVAALVRQWRQGARREVYMLAGVLVVATIPAFIDLVLISPAGLPFPALEFGITAAILFYSVLTSHDVAQAAGLRQEIAESEERFRGLVETAPEAIGVFDAETRRSLGMNGRAERLLGRSRKETVSLTQFLPGPAGREGEWQARAVALVDRARAAEAAVEEWEVAGADGTLVPCEVRVAALESGHQSLLRVSVLDISERRAMVARRSELESRLRQAERLETLGTLAGGIAHDFNNMLTPIVGYGELVQEELGSHPARLYVAEMQAAAQRARQLTCDILMFSRRITGRRDVFEFQSVVEKAVRFLRATIPARIGVEVALVAPAAQVVGDQGQFHQVLMCLGTNAAQAMPDGGTLRISLQPQDGSVELCVADSGVGIEPDVKARMFDPFFTTREPGAGSGLGLSVVHGVVMAAGGTIEVDTAPGRGTTFRIRLPRADTTAAVLA